MSHSMKIVDASFLRLFSCVWSAKPEYPDLRLVADDAIMLGGIQGLGSSLCICGYNQDINSNDFTHILPPSI